jgi:bifunctional N-acetylglucosamine-1-phosphate-uridyltransferase/glucosamine-1-phosphate-acetyltransferase GlmU-like protein
MSLPPLPRNKALEQACGFDALHYHEAIAYGQACRDAALEEAVDAIEDANARRVVYLPDAIEIIRSLK